nr:unnamed protein product [Callosobruchus chinensis]
MTMADYYKILNIPRSATKDQIKKAYKLLALKWHPDKNPDKPEEACKRFREISQAYEVLSDPKKKKSYDLYGRDGFSSRLDRDDDGFCDYGGFGLFNFRDPEEIFREFFGGSISDLFGLTSPSRRSSHRRGSNQSNRSHSLFTPLNVMDSFFGGGSPFASFSAVESSSIGGSHGNQNTYMRQMSTDTQIINGKETTTKRIIENGKEIIEKYENGVLTFKSVNGKPASITYR